MRNMYEILSETEGKYMKVAGIIAEYNPFHKGHEYHIKETKNLTGATHMVAVMSGDFVMRGEPAMTDKKTRAAAAVAGGVDLVLELPLSHALSSAEFFAYGGVYILDAIGCVDMLSFGSEEGELSELTKIAELMEYPETKEKIKEEMKSGISVFKAITNILPGFENITDKPNNILGINYLKALNKLKSRIEAVTLERKGSYNSDIPEGGFASAKAIRNMLERKEDVSEWIPLNPLEYLKDEFVSEKNFDKIMTYALRMADKENLKKYADVSEGLENLIKKAAMENDTVSDIAMAIKSKRYAYTRIKRIMYNILLDIPKNAREENPSFVRVLAFNEKGREILSKMRKTSSLPVITNPTRKDFYEFPELRREQLASSIYELCSR